MYKIVDTFNGFESDARFHTFEEATEILLQDMEDFYKNNSENTRYMRQVVLSDLVWEWDYKQNKYRWTK